MAEIAEGAGPALAAHSKDASTPGATPASAASGPALSSGLNGQTIAGLLNQMTDMVQRQPFACMAACMVVGLLCGRMHSGR